MNLFLCGEIFYIVDRRLFVLRIIHPQQEYLRVIHTGRQHHVQHGIYCQICEINLTHNFQLLACMIHRMEESRSKLKVRTEPRAIPTEGGKFIFRETTMGRAWNEAGKVN